MATTNNIMANSNVWTKQESDPYAGNTDRLASDKHTFLKLLVAQLTNQDPLNPTEDKEFVAQLAQFTSLEQLQEINAGMENLNTTMHQSQLMTATGFIGKDVVTTGMQVTKMTQAGNIYTSRAWYTFDQEAAKVQATVLDGNGNIVYQEDLGAHSAGDFYYDWHGRNMVGQEVSNGVYSVVISGQDKNGSAVLSKQQITAHVYGVTNEDGVYKLILDGGRVVPLMDVTQITNSTSTGEAATYSSLTADAATAAYYARTDAELYRDKALGETTAEGAKKYAESAVKSSETAKSAYDKAQKYADGAQEEAEGLKTAAAKEEADKAKENAATAKTHWEKAVEAAEEAKQYARGLGAVFEGDQPEEETPDPEETP